MAAVIVGCCLVGYLLFALGIWSLMKISSMNDDDNNNKGE